jgi:pimeloyl-ACP methyl ester carboxylesterase
MTPATIPGFADHDAVIGDVRLHYRLGGDPDGPPVVLQHGWAGTSYMWRRVATRLAGAGCAVLIPDLRGYGDSGKPAGTAGYDGRSLAEDARGLVRRLGFGGGRPVVVAAHDRARPVPSSGPAPTPGKSPRSFTSRSRCCARGCCAS